MQLLEKGVNKDLLKGQFDAVFSMERGIAGDMNSGNRAGMIERFIKMYNLNYTGGTQIWDMMRNSANWTEKDWEEAEGKIKGFQIDPDMRSDSQRLQDVLTNLEKPLAEIGKLNFDKLEMPKLTEQVGILNGHLKNLTDGNSSQQTITQLEESLLPKVGSGAIPLTETISTLISKKFGAESHNVNQNLIRLSNAESQDDDIMNQMLSRKYNAEILPLLAKAELSENLVDMIHTLTIKHSDALSGLGNRSKVDSREYTELINIMNNILRELGVLDNAINQLQSNGLPIFGNLNATYYG